MRKTTPKYQSTVHTLEIQPILRDANGETFTDWFKRTKERNLPYVRWDEMRPIINPHKVSRNDDWKFVFEYRTIDEIESAMNKIMEGMEIDGYTIKRLDLCFDTECGYGVSEKLIRLIVLMLSVKEGLNNRFQSIDPLTLEAKTIVAANGTKYTKSLEIEHYNRELLSQDKWSNAPITNRLELRAMGAQAGVGRTIRSIAKNWLERLEGLTEEHLRQVTEQLTDGIYHRWTDYCEELDCDRNPSQVTRNVFYSCQADNIYTKDQLVTLYGNDKQTAKSVDNLLMLNRYGIIFDLYTFDEVKAEVDRLIRAAKQFLLIK